MSVLVVGVSHNSAPVSLLEQVAPQADAVPKLIQSVAACEHVTEATVIATCNRVEIYADVDRFHGSVEELSRLLVERSGKSTEAMLPHLYVHYDDGAVSHLFQVAAGLDSMAVGEGQILGQTRDALRLGQELGTVGPALNVLFQQALRVGKRSRAETDIDSAAPTLVGAALDRSARHGSDVAGRRVVVVGAGAMAGLATATVVATRRRRGRRGQPHPRARRPAGRTSTPAGRPRSATCPRSSPRPTWSSPAPAPPGCWSPAPRSRRPAPTAGRWSSSTWPCPTTSTPSVAELRRRHPDRPRPTSPRSSRTPTPAARSPRCAGSSPRRSRPSSPPAARRASPRPSSRCARWPPRWSTPRWSGSTTGSPTSTPEARAEVLRAVRRVADKLLHEPTVRVKELANETGAVSYAAALAELFALDPEAVDAVTRPEGLA